MRRTLTAVCIYVASAFSALAQSAAPMGPTAAPLPQTTSNDFSTLGITSYQIPVYAQSIDVWLLGAGGGGGSGRQGASSSIRTGGAGGSAGGVWREKLPVSFFGGPGSIVPVVVGTGGAGGAAQASASTNGNPGQPGQLTGIGTIFLYQQPATINFEAITYSGTQFVAVGASGGIYTSTSGTSSWTSRTSGIGTQLNGIVYSSSLTLYVAVGASGVILTSPNAITWTSRTSGVSTTLNAILWDGTHFVVVGNAGVILTSTNGTTWTANAYSSANNLVDVAYDGTSIYNAVDNTGNVVETTSPTGTWTATQITTSSSYPFTSISFGNGLWVAVGNQSLYTSVTGTSWTAGTAFSGINQGAPASIRYANGYWWLLNGINVYWSYAASSWFHTINGNGIGAPSGPQGTAYGAGVWIVLAASGYLATTTAVAPYSLYACNGLPGAGGAAAPAVGGVQVDCGMFVTGKGSSSIDTGALVAPGDGAAGGGGSGGSADASNTGYAPTNGGNANIIGWVPAGEAGTATLPPGAGASTTGSLSEWGGSGCGGGAWVASTIGQAGATTGSPSAGGCGGGASDNTFTSGAGSAGGNGEVKLGVSAM